MQRITLNKPFRCVVSLRLGAESVSPIDYGSYSPQLENDNEAERTGRRSRPRSQEQPRIWTLDYNDETRSILAPNEVSVHYFGNPRAGSDMDAVEMMRLPSFNIERQRVADMWGGYDYSRRAESGKYHTIKIAVPDMPDVTIENVNNSGTVVGDFKFEPLKFWKFEELLSEFAAEEVAEIQARRGKKTFSVDLDDITPAQLDELAAKLGARLEKRKVTAGQ